LTRQPGEKINVRDILKVFVFDQEWYESHPEELAKKRVAEKKRAADRRTAAQKPKGKGRVLDRGVPEELEMMSKKTKL
jgi:hypothetical protein